jgi:hypothetical protein
MLDNQKKLCIILMSIYSIMNIISYNIICMSNVIDNCGILIYD